MCSTTSEETLSYDCFKSIWQHMSLQKREQIHWKIGAYRKAEGRDPYHLESVELSESWLNVNGREWNIGPLPRENFNPEGIDDDLENNQKEALVTYRFNESRFLYVIEEGPKVVFKQLFDEYLKNGVKIGSLLLYCVPEFLNEKDPKTYKINVRDLNLKINDHLEFQKILPFIKHNKLQKIHFCLRETSLPMLNEELVQRAEEIFIQLPYHDPIPLNTLLQNIPNKYIHIIYFRLPIEKVQEVANSWKESRRAIGSSFNLAIENYFYVLDVFDRLKEQLGAIPSKTAKPGYFSHSVTIPICDDLELVVSGGPMKIKWPPHEWTLSLEVMKRGSTIAK